MVWKKITAIITLLAGISLLPACAYLEQDDFERPDRDEWYNISSRRSLEREALTKDLMAPGQSLHRYYRNPSLASIQQHEMLSPGPGGIGQVYIAEVLMNGIPFHVASFSPRVVRMGGGPDSRAVTAVRFAKNREALTFFSRDPQTGEGYLAEIPLTRANGFGFDFPVMSPDGRTLEPGRMQIVRVEQRPPLVNELARFQHSGVLKR